MVEDSLVSLSSLFQSFRVFGKNDCPNAVFFVEMYLQLFLVPLVLESDLSRRLHNGILIFPVWAL